MMAAIWVLIILAVIAVVVIVVNEAPPRNGKHPRPGRHGPKGGR